MYLFDVVYNQLFTLPGKCNVVIIIRKQKGNKIYEKITLSKKQLRGPLKWNVLSKYKTYNLYSDYHYKLSKK